MMLGYSKCNERKRWMPLELEFKSPVRSGFFAFFGRKLDWTALGSLGMVPGLLKDQSKVVATSLSKNRSKTGQNWSKTGQNC